MTVFYPFVVEVYKLRRSKITWLTFIAFGLAPVMGGVFILIMNDPHALARANLFKAKAIAMNFTPDWSSYLSILTQAVGVGGILVFGFVGSWIFGREYSDGTSKDMLSLPTSRVSIINAKFLTYGLWCILLSLSNLVIGIFIGTALAISGWDEVVISHAMTAYFVTTLLTILAGTPVAFFALYGEGYLAPLGFVAIALVFAQIIAAAGFGNYFPWAVPGLYSGAAGEYREQLNTLSYGILLLVSAAGFLATQFWWRFSDQPH